MLINQKKLNHLLIGAGESAYELIDNIKKNKIEIKIIGILDDLEKKQNIKIKDVPVLGSIKEIKKIIRRENIHIVIICIENISKKLLEFIIDSISKLKIRVKIKIIPAAKEYLSKNITFNKIRDLSAEDIIGRKNIVITKNIIENKFANKTILITGAGGTIGSAVCHQLLDYPLKKIICVCRGENSLYLLKEIILAENKKVPIKYYLGNVKDYERMQELIDLERPDIIFHTAAHKHVLLMEENEKEAIKNNVFATLNLLKLSLLSKIQHFVFISTDKAVNPSNIMGASKNLGEILVNYFGHYKKLSTSIVRFGNVIGSRGSVVPLFNRQIQKGGPITITDPEVKRYFMTIPEAASLVINAGALSNGGETYMLDMGKPVKIDNLVKRMLVSHGYRINKDVEIKYTGLKSGEKLNEELFNQNDSIITTINTSIYEIKTKVKDYELKKIYKNIIELKKNFKQYTRLTLRDWINKNLKIKLINPVKEIKDS